MVGDSGARVIICENAAQVAKIDQVRAGLPDLEHVVIIDGEAPGAMSMADVAARGAGGDADGARPAGRRRRPRRRLPDHLHVGHDRAARRASC